MYISVCIYIYIYIYIYMYSQGDQLPRPGEPRRHRQAEGSVSYVQGEPLVWRYPGGTTCLTLLV